MAARRDDGGARRALLALAASALVLVIVPVLAHDRRVPGPPRPNVLLVLTDDQPWGTVPAVGGRAAMPWLESQLDDPSGGWVRFTNAFVNVPLCCPSRASILTGRLAGRTGVEGNGDGSDLDESWTLATWLDGAGYQTAFIGKYLNGYPWRAGPSVPPGWDRFLAKRNLDVSTTYRGYPFVDQGVPLTAGTGDAGYATSLLAEEAMAFLRGADADRPWFLVYAPSAPHEPWTPAAVDAGSFAGEPMAGPGLATMNDVTDTPSWVRSLPEIDPATARSLEEHRRRMMETLAAVDRAMHAFVGAVAERGELGRTLIVFLSDNGFSFGEHRWVGKRCPYDACVRVPLIIRSPWTEAAEVTDPVSNVDLAPTIADLAGLDSVPQGSVDGVSLLPYLVGTAQGGIAREGVPIEYAGDADVPGWRGLRTAGYSYIEHADGTIELFDIAGARGRPDPWQVRNVAAVRRYADVRRALAGSMEAVAGDATVQASP